MNRIILNILRVAISVGLLAYLIYLADIEKLYLTLKTVNTQFFLLALFIFFICLNLLSKRWQILLSKLEIKSPYKLLFNFYFIGFFFNNFLPTSIGGDVSRAYNVAKISGKKAISIGVVLLERILGLLATLTLASVSTFWVMKFFHTPRIIFLTLTMFAIVIFLLVNLLFKRSFNFTGKLLGKITIFNIGDRIHRILETIHSFRNNKRTIIKAYLISLTSQILFIVMNYILAKSLNLQQVSLGFLFIVVPVSFLLSLFPSINGLGVRDSAYVFLLTRIGVSPAEALSLSFLNTFVPILFSLYGGILLIFYRNNKSLQTLTGMKS
jgi:uncharacterized protein (TIRG00374 family)